MRTGYSGRDTQIRLASLGCNPGPIDGMVGAKTRRAMAEAMEMLEVDRPSEIFHPSGLLRVHWHWSGGARGIIALERKSYNLLIDHDCNIHDGKFRPEAQATYAVGKAASHTLNANSHAIGVCVDGMAGAEESPFDAGSAPMNKGQIETLAECTADFCERYDIRVSKWTTLSHAEVQPTLGIRQRWKWDITWLPGMTNTSDAVRIGDTIRGMVSEILAA